MQQVQALFPRFDVIQESDYLHYTAFGGQVAAREAWKIVARNERETL